MAETEQGQRADKSAVGAINRPLRRVGRPWELMCSMVGEGEDGADKSAVGAVNRPLRRGGRPWELMWRMVGEGEEGPINRRWAR
jgi:hypothetical protein